MQKKTIVAGIALVAVIAVLAVVAVGGLVAYNFILGETEAPSGPITAIPVVVNTSAPAPTGEAGPAAAEPTGTAAADPASSLIVFQISQEESEARFLIYEDLRGQPNTVLGATNQVAGELALDLSDLSKTQVGVIQANARTLVTDNDRRNGAIRRFILNSDQYEFLTFTPTAITGLSGAAQPGQPFTFEVAGDLTIRNVTQPAVFTVTAVGESAARITGAATTVIKRSDFGLTIPNVPNVANVGNDVTLEFDFVAVAAG